MKKTLGKSPSLSKGEDLLQLAFKNHQDISILLLRSGIDLNRPIAKDKQTALHLTCRKPQPKTVKLLLKLKAQVDVQDSNKFTPLHYAAARGLSKIMEILLNHGAKVDSNESGMTPLFCLAAYFQTKGDPKLTQRQAECVDLLIEHKAGVDKRRITEMSALYMMGARMNIQAVQSLLKAGAQILDVCPLDEFPKASAVVDFVKDTGLPQLSIFGHPKITEIILDYALATATTETFAPT